MPEDDFFVYMRSSENYEEFPNNSATGFTNLIRPPLILDDEYEIALHSYYYRPSYYSIKAYDKSFFINFNVECINKDGGTLNWFSYKYSPRRNIIGTSIPDAINLLNADLKQELIINQVIDESNEPILTYNTVENIVQMRQLKPLKSSEYKDYKIVYTFSDKMGILLGVGENETENPTFLKQPQLANVDLLMVYSDIIAPSSIGDQRVNILDIIPSTNIIAKNTVGSIFKTIQKRVVSEISIKITNGLNQPINFTTDVDMFIVLHFRLKK